MSSRNEPRKVSEGPEENQEEVVLVQFSREAELREYIEIHRRTFSIGIGSPSYGDRGVAQSPVCKPENQESR